ncbi:putative ysirk family gram-positive signal peptide protein [Botrytis fragariae]|uniref:Putative ysirk family gram-positive signal peptide protein n=1 Tax=Botrytis fragariae TaxID=1964551 RepID=A0A8H6EKX2_9HELO|nr:putative ysirk family gram-positive signal peptide protein [Botrytis fragariae]KAF5876033.1 putative ysirk family gram-positive signal peptide protein [Botrytis fragariae]
MAPTAADPKDLKLILNPARRRALNILIGSITEHMRKTITDSFSNPSNQSNSNLNSNIPGPNPNVSSYPNPHYSNTSSPASTPTSEIDLETAQQRRLEARLNQNLSTPKLQALEKAALNYFDSWRDSIITQLGKILNSPDDPRADQKKKEFLASRPPPPYSPASNNDNEPSKDILAFQTLYPPIPTRLTTISLQDRIHIVSSLLIIVLSLGTYSAHSRVLLCILTSSLSLPPSFLTHEEIQTSRTLLLASKAALNADAETAARATQNTSSRRWKVGLASVAGAALIGVTGGLAAPVVAGAIGGLWAQLVWEAWRLFWAFFYAREVEDFKFLDVKEEWGEFGTKEEEEVEKRRLRVLIGVNGWVGEQRDIIRPWRKFAVSEGDEDNGHGCEVFALRYETNALVELGNSLKDTVGSYAWSMVKMEILKRTVLATLWGALWPVYLLKMATGIDNPFARAKRRAEKAGEVLADALINRAQGERPVMLVGYSLGSRVIYSCLRSLAERHAFGLIDSVVLIGSPIPSSTLSLLPLRTVISGPLLNVYNPSDLLLAFLYRFTSLQYGISGLQPIEHIEGVTNIDVSSKLNSHLKYEEVIDRILGTYVFPSMSAIDGEKWENGGKGEEGISMIDGEGPIKKDEIEEELLIDFGEVAELEADVPLPSGHLDSKDPNISSTASNSYDMEDLLGSPATPTEIVTSTTIKSISDAHFASHSNGTISPSNTTSTTTLATPNTTTPSSPSPYYSCSEDEGGIQMVDNDDDLDMHIQLTAPETLSTSSLNEAGRIEKGMSGLVITERSIDDVKHESPVEPKSLGSLPRGDRKKAADFGLY